MLVPRRVRPHLGVSKNTGTPNWMVKIMENPIKIDDLGVSGIPIFGNSHLNIREPTGSTATLATPQVQLLHGFKACASCEC